MARSDPVAASDAIWPGFIRLQARVMRLVLIDDHPVVREGVCALLSIECDMRIVGEAGDIDSGIELVRRHEPDLVLCDLTMPGCTGGIAVQKLCQECPTARVLVLTAQDSLECMRQAFMAGAIGYVRKTAVLVDLLSAVRRAASGRHVVCRGVSDALTRSWLQGAGLAPAGPAAELAPQDRQILRLIAMGVPTRRIASDLRRGVKVVEKYRANLLRRLNLNSTAAVARFAVRSNLLSHEEIDHVVSSQ